MVRVSSARDVPVGDGDTSEQIREGGEIARTIGLEMIERLERLAQRRELTLLGRVDTQPGTNRFQRHCHQTIIQERNGSSLS